MGMARSSLFASRSKVHALTTKKKKLLRSQLSCMCSLNCLRNILNCKVCTQCIIIICVSTLSVAGFRWYHCQKPELYWLK